MLVSAPTRDLYTHICSKSPASSSSLASASSFTIFLGAPCPIPTDNPLLCRSLFRFLYIVTRLFLFLFLSIVIVFFHFLFLFLALFVFTFLFLCPFVRRS